MNCTIFNAKVKSANGKKSLAKFYAGSCNYLLLLLLLARTVAQPSHVARLHFTLSQHLAASSMYECLVAASFWQAVAYADASCQEKSWQQAVKQQKQKGPKAHGPRSGIRTRTRTRMGMGTRQLFPFVKCLPDWQEIATADIDGCEFVVALNVSSCRAYARQLIMVHIQCVSDN